MQLGEWQLHTLNGGRFRLDAGVMYGIIPKTVWQTLSAPDAQNRIPFSIHCVLARNAQYTVLIDTGYGNKMSRLDRSAHAATAGDPLTQSLQALGVTPESIDAVVFSHLHWDHAGGATRFDEEQRCVPAFPNATYFVNRWEWEDANSGAPELGGSYAPENFAVLESSGQLALVEGETELLPGLSTRLTGGHTRGHQAVLLESQSQVAVYPGDLCPAVTHLRRMWCTAYDLYPLDVRRYKPELLGAAADGGWWILWDHDPDVAASRIERHRSKEFVICDPRAAL